MLKPLSVQEEVPKQLPPPHPENAALSLIRQESSAPPQEPPASEESSPVQQKSPSQPGKFSMDVIVQPSLLQHEVTISPIGLDEAQHPVLPNINVKEVDLKQGSYDS